MPKRKQLDGYLLFATLVCALVGIALVWSASAPLARDYYRLPSWDFAYRQFLAWLLGTAVMLAVAMLPLDRLLTRTVAWTGLALTWVLLVVPYFQPEVAQTHRWLRLPFGSFQPSGLAKLTLPLALAVVLAELPEKTREQHRPLSVAALFVGLTVALVYFEPDLGTALLLAGTSLAMLFVGGTNLPVLMGAGAAALGLGVVGILAEPYRLQRFTSFLSGNSYQVQQALIALGSGGFFGRGPGASVQKLFFLPQPHTDFIFAVAGEEMGFLGATFLLAVLGFLVARCFKAALASPNRAGALLAVGLGTQLALQTLLHVTVCLGLVPAKGIPLPLISAGGSDLLAHLVGLGLVLNVAKEGS